MLSLCVPTNGIVEWVIPVLDSIYENAKDLELFEVVITDNGNNSDLGNAIVEYTKKYSNLVYRRTAAKMFLNQIEAFKLAKGQLIKFVNHRMPLLPGALDYLIKFASEYKDSKPSVYFSNGVLKLKPVRCQCSTFDSYVRRLSYWSSWSAGTTIWKSDFDSIDLDREFNALFPHTDIVFYNKKSKNYIVDDTPLLYEIPTDITKKGKYDLFNAFAIEYPDIIEGLYKDGYISKETYEFVIKKNGNFVSECYLEYIVRRRPSSYKLDNYSDSFGKYYSETKIKCMAHILRIKSFVMIIPRYIKRKIKR